MKAIFLFLLFILFSVSSFAQDDVYEQLADSTKKYFQLKNYDKSSEYSIKALTFQEEGSIDVSFLYNSAVIAAKSKKYDLGIYLMQQAANAGFSDYAHASVNKDFFVEDKRWMQCLKKMESNSSILSNLSSQLDSIFLTDQNVRQQYVLIQQSGNSDSLRIISDKIRVIDSLNLQKVEDIIYNYGYYGRSLKSWMAQNAIFTVVLHSNSYSVLSKYFLLFREAAKRGEFYRPNLAYVEDRLLLMKYGKQKYGTQYNILANGEIKFFPFIDELKVDQFRLELGLNSLLEYQKEIRKPIE